MGNTIVKALVGIVATVMLSVASIYLIMGCIYLVSDYQIGLLMILFVVYMLVSYIISIYNNKDDEE